MTRALSSRGLFVGCAFLACFTLALLPGSPSPRAFAQVASTEDGGTDGGSTVDEAPTDDGSGRDTPENEDSTGRTPQSCRATSDCERGFACEGGRCVYAGFRDADSKGCSAAGSTTAGAIALGIALLAAGRNQRRNSRHP